eukprot:TRINITY_DN43295_c0_g1_i1.p1 TRINITY_DN43295_c0_g1~~TRINITY_DN43295_c0_g1_i1.p1  ORF type:complete len:235 (+),score=43.14 TRINITY_DN43295_c0_g1_i1:41-706(+)
MCCSQIAHVDSAPVLPSYKKRCVHRTSNLLIITALLVVAVLLLALSPSSQTTGEHRSTARLRGLAKTLRYAMNSEVDIVVQERSGGFGFSREELFGDRDGKAVYAAMRMDEAVFMKQLKDKLRRTKAWNYVIAKSDSIIDVHDIVASFTITMRGALNTEYLVIAFNGSGTVDRRGKPGGHVNWSLRGHLERDGMRVTFFNRTQAEERGTHLSDDSCSSEFS